MKEALGFTAPAPAPAPTDPTLAYTNAGQTSTLRVGSVSNTVAITQVPILNYDAPTTLQPNPIPIDIRIDPPNASPLDNVRIAEFHWIKQDPSDQDKYGYFNLGDGYFKIGAEWAGFGPQTVILEGESVAVNAIGNQDGTTGLELAHGGDSVTPPTTAGRLWMDTRGQLNFNHILPQTSAGNQVLFFPTNCEAASLTTTTVGGTGQVILPFTNIISSSEQDNEKHFELDGAAVQYVGTSLGLFFVTATIALNTTTGGANVAIAHFALNGGDVQFSATRHTINQNQEDTVVIQAFIPLSPNDTIEVVLSSADFSMTAQDYPAVVGPPDYPAQPAVYLVAYRIA